MRITRFLTVLCILLLTFVFTASAQKTKRPAPRPTPKPTPISPDVTTAKQQVSNQLYNINVFVDKMGPIAVAIEDLDREAASGKLKKEAVDANEANKKKIIAAAALGLVALLVLGYVLFGGGSSKPATNSNSLARTSPTPKPVTGTANVVEPTLIPRRRRTRA